MIGKLYLIPTTLGNSTISSVIPNDIINIIVDIKYFIVENERTARRYLKKLLPSIVIDDLTFFILNKHTKPAELASFIEPIMNSNDVGVISEAGCPGVADPGADIVAIAHVKGYIVVPLVGPSSILLALMASGMNGQNFAFLGYIPVKGSERIKYLKNLETKSRIDNQTQIFIETPYRNNQLFSDLINYCSDSTMLCVATDITLETENIKTRTIKKWKKVKYDLNKRPSIFLIHSS